MHECPEEYWVSVLADLKLFMLLTDVILISPRTSASLQSICARVYVLGGNARPKLMNCMV